MRNSDSVIPSHGVVEFANLGSAGFEHLISYLSTYQRFQSYALFRSAGIPTLDGFLVLRWNKETPHALRASLQSRRWSCAMLRSDAAKSAHLKPRGGNVIDATHIVTMVRRTIGEGRIALVLEPASRFDDVHSGNVLFDPNDPWLYWEVVGPGFDMSDLNRGDSLPHESFLTLPETEVEDWGHLSPLDIRVRRVIGQQEYLVSWEHRLCKVGRMAPGEFNHISDEAARGRTFLLATGHPLLLRAQTGYTPLGYEDLCTVFSYAARIPCMLTKLWQSRGLSYTVSYGFLLYRGLVFWDVFPSTYYDSPK